jgi:hypothetical protein
VPVTRPDAFTLADPDGDTFVVSVSWVRMRFTGTPFRSRPQRDLLVVAEGAAVSGTPDPAFFSVVVDVAAELPG